MIVLPSSLLNRCTSGSSYAVEERTSPDYNWHRVTRSLLIFRNLLAVATFVAAGVAKGADPLATQVTIYRDHYGTPHIVGTTEQATFFGYGYAQAQDHLTEMMLQYRDAQGRRAEVQGINALGDGYLHFIPYEYRWDGDYLQRLLRTRKCVDEHKGEIEPETYQILDGFARGVNQYMAEHRATIAKWITPITAEDVEALERSQYMRFYSIHDALIKLSETTFDFPNFGSNQWAISPERSANGRVIHVEHTHMPWANRFQNYEAHLITPGKLDAAGISWFGSPVFLDGWNDKITWSATWNEPNIADVYEERLNPKNPLQYFYDGKWLDIKMEQETFRVKGPADLDSVTMPLYYTIHGPVVKYDREANRAYSVKLPNFEGVNYATGLFLIMKAHNLSEFKAAVSRQLMPRWNLLYSDEKNIFWVHNGNVARRDPSYDWSKPVPGWTSKTQWGPYLPFEDYPQVLNPVSGFLQNCNNPPWVCTRNSGLKPLQPTSYYLRVKPLPDAGEEVLNTRGERLFQVLGENKKFTVDEMTRLGFDTHVMSTDVIVPLLQRAYDGQIPEKDVAEALHDVRNWDGSSSKESTAYTYIHYWGEAYEQMFSKGSFARFLGYERKKVVDINSPEEQTRARAALENAVRTIKEKFGSSSVRWGRINVVVRGGTFPLGGESMYDVLHRDEGVEQEDGTIHCNDGWGHLMIVVEGNPKQVWTLLPYGESQDPSSPHYNDQARLHSQRMAKPFPFTSEEILANTESVWGDRNRLNRLRQSDPSVLSR
jgi:acyl-homoserine lactone acylase PvdQ